MFYIDIITKLCNEYHYGGAKDHAFLMLAYGWLWGHTKDPISTNCLAGILMLKMNEIYKEVAAQNNW